MSEGFVLGMGVCFACRRPFTFNPHKVPVLPYNGERHPICAVCMDAANEKRAAMGLAPHPILPGAYDAMPEGEL